MEIFRIDDTEAGREDVEEEKEVCRDMPAIDVAFTAALIGLEFGGAGAARAGSPARSTNVFLLRWPGGGGSIVDDLTLLTDGGSSANFPGEGMRLG